MRLYLDICAIQRPLDDQNQLRVRAEAEAVLGLLALCEQGAMELVASGVHVVENRRCPYPDRRAHVNDVLTLARSFVSPEAAILERARQYQTVGIDRFDALHLASAVEADVDYFCTTDDHLLRKGKAADTTSTSVVSPLELVTLLH
ncbi:MAG: nucleic acid-binding protein [Bacteroidetes bacterium]|jgi:predicted nucleic acid-binding protein|nr:nucleic acid-binding protein [Bacteroidota bacterium]